MPVIEKLNATNRMQVTSPVPIKSSASARMSGETIAQFGDDLIRASANVNDFLQKTEAAAQSSQLAAIAEEGELMAAEAETEAANANDPSGANRLNNYVNSFKEKQEALLESIEDPKVRASAATVLSKARNKNLDSIQRSVAKTREDFIKNSRDAAVGKQYAAVAKNPAKVLEVIQRNVDSLEQVKDVYTPAEYAKLSAEEPKNLASAAVQSLINDESFGNGRFATAKQMVNGELAGILGADVKQANEDIDKAARSWRGEMNTRADRAETEGKKAAEEHSEEITRGFIVQLGTNNAVVPAPLKKQIRDAYITKQISEKQYEQLLKWNRSGDRAAIVSSDAPLLKYQLKISNGDVGNVTNEILRDVEAGLISSNDGSRLMQNAAIVRSQKNRANVDPTIRQEMVEADQVVRQAMYENDALPPERTREWVDVQSELMNEVARGTPPLQAAKKAVKNSYTKVARTVFVDSSVLPKGMQQTAEGLTAAKPQLDAAILQLAKSGSSADKVKGINAMKAYMQRMNALNGLKEVSE